MIKSKTITFRVDNKTFNILEKHIGYKAKSAYIRMLIEKDIERCLGKIGVSEVMKCGTGTGLFDMHDEEIRMCDRLLLHDSDGSTHKILVGFNLGMFVEDGTGSSLFSVIEPYACYNGGEGVEIRRR